MKQLPPPTPPYTGGEPNARTRRDATAPHLHPLPKGRAMDAQIHRNPILPLCKGRAMDTQIHRDPILPLCKGELEGVAPAPAPCGRNLKSKIQNHKS